MACSIRLSSSSRRESAQRVGGGRLEGRGRRGPFLRVAPVRGDARGRLAGRLQEGGDGAVQRLRDGLGHRAEHDFVEQVVGEAAVADHVRGFELAPGVGELDDRAAGNVRGQLDAEVETCDRGHPREGERPGAQQLEAAGDQRADVVRRGQGFGRRVEELRAAGDQRAQGLQHEQRVAAGVAPQRLRPARSVEPGNLQRLEQRFDRGRIERPEPDLGERVAITGMPPFVEQGRHLAGAAADAPGDRRARAAAQRRQRGERGLVGVLRVVEDDERQARLRPRRQRLGDGALERARVEPAGVRRAQLGHHARELAARPAGLRLAEARRQGAQRTRHHRVGQACVAGPRGHDDRTVDAGGVVLEQACLADAGLAADEGRASRGECGGELRAFPVAPHQPGRAQDGDRHRRRLQRR